MTRFVLPHLLPAQFRIRDVTTLGSALSRLAQYAHLLRWPAAILLLAACILLFANRSSLLNDTIASLSPLSQADVALDASLRADLGAPDVRYLVVVTGPDRESVLQGSEQVSAKLQMQVDQGELAGFESPSRYLPSLAIQRARQASLPPSASLRSNLVRATSGLPVRPALFEPFLADVEVARSQSLLQSADLEKTSMAVAVDALLIRQHDHWSALLPLTAPAGSNIDANRIRAALNTTGLSNVLFVDMKAESDRLYAGYLHEVILLSLGGLAAIIGLLLWVFRSPIRMLRIIAPLAAAVVTVTAGLTLFGQQLIILHLVGLLLVVAVGSNYALFFDRVDPYTPLSPRILTSMLFANFTAVTGFGLLAFSKVSVLQAMGVTVTPGVILALIYAAIFARVSHV